MLEQVDVDKKMSKDEYEKKMESLSTRLGELQRKCKEQKIPVMVTFDGVDAAGKGTMINRVIQFLDPRGYRVFTTGKAGEEEKMRPYFWRFFTKTPEKGRMHIFDQSWYRGVYEGEIGEKDATEFEKMLIQDGTLIVKFFLLISAKEQKKRLEKMEKDEDTRWRVCKQEKENNKNYAECLKKQDSILVHTDIAESPWVIVEGTDKLYAACKIVSTLVSRMEEALQASLTPQQETPKLPEAEECFRNGVLHGIDLSKSMTKEEYQVEKKKLQKKLRSLHNQMYLKRLPVVLRSKAGMPEEKEARSNVLRRPWIRVVMKWFRQRPQMMLKKPIIICGDSGKNFQKQDIWRFLTVPGMEECWSNVSKVLRQKVSGNGLIARSMTWKNRLPMREEFC